MITNQNDNAQRSCARNRNQVSEFGRSKSSGKQQEKQDAQVVIVKANTDLEPLKLSRLLLENSSDASFLPSLQVSLTAIYSAASGIFGDCLLVLYI